MKPCMILLVSVVATAAWAVQPVTTEHTSEADFTPADSTGVIVWSLGEVTLGAVAETVLASRDDIEAVTAAVAASDGAVYVGSATKGLVLRVGPDGAIETVADLPSAMVTDLAFDGDRLLAATAGDGAGIYVVDPVVAAGTARKLWSDEDVGAVWAIAPAGGVIYAATAPAGKLYAVTADGEGEVIFTAEQKVLRSILASNDGVLYVGTGQKGLIYRIDLDRHGVRSRVLLDAEEAEIVAMVRDAAGNLYAAATNVTTATPSPPSNDDTGRPVPTPAPSPPPSPAATPAEPTITPPEDTGPVESEDDAEAPTSGADAIEAHEPAGQTDAAAVVPNISAQHIPAPDAAQTEPPSRPSEPPRPDAARSRAAPGRGGPSAAGRSGNTIYCIDPVGLVNVVEKVPATILDMALTTRPARRLVVATGAGEVRVVELATGAAGALAKLDPKQVTTLAVAHDGTIYAGTTDPALLARIGPEPARRGTFISEPIDAKQVAQWGTVRAYADIPDGAAVTLAARTGNVEEPSDETWSDWTGEIAATDGWAALGAPVGRLLQYRLALSGASGGCSPVVDTVKVVHQVGNLAPEIKSVEVAPSQTLQQRRGGNAGGDEPLRYRMVTIKASDPNDDPLRYDLFYRLRGTDVWLRWAEGLAQPTAAWDTRTVPDGLYEIKVVATDDLANPPATALTDKRLSRVVIVDNTPPRIVELATTVDGRTVRLHASLADANRIAAASYRLNSEDEQVPMAAADGIFDSPNEKVAVTITDLAPGPHAITLRVADEFANVAYATVHVTIGE